MEEETSILMPVPSDIGLQVHKPPAIKKAEKVSVPVEQTGLEICKIRIAWARRFFPSALVSFECKFFLAWIVSCSCKRPCFCCTSTLVCNLDLWVVKQCKYWHF